MNVLRIKTAANPPEIDSSSEPGEIVRADAGQSASCEPVKMHWTSKLRLANLRAETRRPVQDTPRLVEDPRYRAQVLALQRSRSSTWSWDLSTDAFRCHGESEGLYGQRRQPPPRDGAAWLLRIHRDDRERVADVLNRCREGRDDALCIEYRVNLDETRTRWLLTRGGLEDSPRPDSRIVVGTTMDVTVLRTAPAPVSATPTALRRQMFEAVGQISDGVAHDLNNLLGVISNLAELQQRGAATSPMAAISQQILSVVARGALLTRKLTQLAKPDGARSFALEDGLDGMSDLMRLSAGDRVEVRVAIAADAWPIHVDASQLQLAVMNLAINSGHAMVEGGTFTVTARNLELSCDEAKALKLEGSDFVEIQVSDTGQGMSNETLRRAFEPYFTTKPAGTGLGLAQVHAFARDAGGAVQARSTPGVGTTISLYLPRAPSSRLE